MSDRTAAPRAPRRRVSLAVRVLKHRAAVAQELAHLFADPRLNDPSIDRHALIDSIMARHAELERRERQLDKWKPAVFARDLAHTRHRLAMALLNGASPPQALDDFRRAVSGATATLTQSEALREADSTGHHAHRVAVPTLRSQLDRSTVSAHAPPRRCRLSARPLSKQGTQTM